MVFTRLSRFDAGIRAALAVSNGYEAEAFIDLDKLESVRGYSDKHLIQADAVLEWWTQYSEERGVALQQILYRGMPVPEREHFKDFLRYYIATHSGLLRDPETGTRRKSPSTRTLLKQASRWYFGFERKTGTKIGEEFKAEIRLWARTQLQKKEKIISGAFRVKPTYGWHQLHACVVSWFSKPMLTFIHGRDLVQTPGLSTLFGFTGARIGAYTEGSSHRGSKRVLNYGDLKVILFNTPSGVPNICIHVISRYTKNNDDPLNRFYGQGIKGHDRLVYDVPSFFLALAFADDAFEHIRTPAQLWSLRLPPGKESHHIPWKASMRDTPIFRSSTRANGTSNNVLTANRFDYYFGLMAKGAGYGEKFTIHAVRREFANKVDHLYTPAERSTPLGHADSDALQSNTHTRYYVANHTSAVDGQAAFLGETPDPDFIDQMRRTQVLQEDDLPQRLPMERQLNMTSHPTIADLNRSIDDLRASGASQSALQALRRKSHSTLQTLKREELRLFQREWLDKRSNDFIVTQLDPQHVNTAEVISSNNEAFLALCELVPERKRLAELISSPKPCSRQEKLKAVQDMTALCTMDHRIVYYPGERPINNTCPVSTCQMSLQSWDLRTSSSHIHDCRRKEFMDKSHATAVRAGHPVISAKTEFCLLCFTWVFGSEAWESHCDSHLRRMLPLTYLNCEVTSYGPTVICPGLCPFCLSSPKRPSERLAMYTVPGLLKSHIRTHLDDLDSWPQRCPHPCCKSLFQDRFALECHFADAHGLLRMLSGSAGLKLDEADFDAFDVEPWETNLMDSDTGVGPLFDVKPGRKRSLDGDDGSLNGLPEKVAKVEISSEKGSPPDTATVPFDSQAWTRDSTANSWENWTPDDFSTSPDTIDLTSSDVEKRVVEPSDADTDSWKNWIADGLATSSDTIDLTSSDIEKRVVEPSDADTDSWKNWIADGSVTSPETIDITLSDDEKLGVHSSSATSPDTIDLTLPDEKPGVEASDGDTDTIFAIFTAARQEKKPEGPVCPICRAPVTESVEIYGSNRLSISQQKRFCRAHKVKRADRDWFNKGYPRIDWEGMPERLSRFIEPLQRVLSDSRLSYFRGILIYEDEDRTVKPAFRGLDYGIPGYYGPRGMDIMHEFLVPTFANQISQLALVDKAILNAGVTGYICRVLTPELATMLIKEDMKVEAVKARVILSESVALGILVNSDT